MSTDPFPTKPPLHPRATHLIKKLHLYLKQLTSIAKLGPELVKMLFHLINAPERNLQSTNAIIGKPLETSTIIPVSKRLKNFKVYSNLLSMIALQISKTGQRIQKKGKIISYILY